MNTQQSLGAYADLLVDIAALSSLPETQKKELIAAVRFMADKIIGLGTGTLIDLNALNVKLGSVSAATFGLKKTSFQNIKSRFRKALKLTGRNTMPGKHTNTLSADWQAVMDLIPTKRRARPISRLAHFASERGWKPYEIDVDKMAVFEAALKTALVPHAQGVYRRSCKALNDFANEVEGWPIPPVSMPSPKLPKSIVWASLPPHLTAEADKIFKARLKSKGTAPSLSDYTSLSEFVSAQKISGGRRWSEATVSGYRYALQRHLSVLLNLEQQTAYPDLKSALVPGAVFPSLMHMIDDAGKLQQMHFRIAVALTSLAAACGATEADIKELRRLEMHIFEELGLGKTGLSEKSKKAVAAVSDDQTRAKLLLLPIALMKSVLKSDIDIQTARTVRTAVALEILIMATLRKSNLVKLRLDKHFLNWADPKAERLQVSIPGDETKGGHDIVFEFPGNSSELIRMYVSKFRPLLPGSDTPWLFPGTKGSHIDSSTLCGQVQKTILTHVGIKMHLHAFRHIAAKLVLDVHPTAYQSVSTLLSHGSIDVTTKYYSGVDQMKAVQILDDLVNKIRKSSI